MLWTAAKYVLHVPQRAQSFKSNHHLQLQLQPRLPLSEIRFDCILSTLLVCMLTRRVWPVPSTCETRWDLTVVMKAVARSSDRILVSYESFTALGTNFWAPHAAYKRLPGDMLEVYIHMLSCPPYPDLGARKLVGGHLRTPSGVAYMMYTWAPVMGP